MENVRVRMWFFEPGDEVTCHYRDEREELFYVVEGTGRMLVGEEKELVEIPEGGMIKPGTTPRQLRNESDERAVWLIVGAPPEVEGRLWSDYDETGRPADEGEFSLEEWFQATTTVSSRPPRDSHECRSRLPLFRRVVRRETAAIHGGVLGR